MTTPDDAGPAFPDLWRRGRHEAWRYVVGPPFALVVAAVWIVAVDRALAALFPGVYPGTTMLDWGTGGAAAALLALAGLFGGLFGLAVGPAVAAVALHHRPWTTLLTAAPRFRWRELGLSAAVAAAVLAAWTLAAWAAGAGPRLVVEPGPFLAVLPAAVALIALAVVGEEVAFRGYLLQVTARWTPRLAVRLAVPAGLFWAAHLVNPEVAVFGAWALVDYALFALYATYLAIRRGGIEAAVGLHVAINLHVLAVAPDPAIWRPLPPVFHDSSGYPGDLVLSVVLYAVHYATIVDRPLAARLRRALRP